MNDVNIPLLRKAVEWVEHQDTLPEIDREWDQGFYRMGHHGRARVLLQGVVPRKHLDWDVIEKVTPHCGTTYCVAGYIGQLLDERYMQTDTVDDVHVADYAKEHLGTTFNDSERLFGGDNTAADVRRIAEEIAGQKL